MPAKARQLFRDCRFPWKMGFGSARSRIPLRQFQPRAGGFAFLFRSSLLTLAKAMRYKTQQVEASSRERIQEMTMTTLFQMNHGVRNQGNYVHTTS